MAVMAWYQRCHLLLARIPLIQEVWRLCRTSTYTWADRIWIFYTGSVCCLETRELCAELYSLCYLSSRDGINTQQLSVVSKTRKLASCLVLANKILFEKFNSFLKWLFALLFPNKRLKYFLFSQDLRLLKVNIISLSRLGQDLGLPWGPALTTLKWSPFHDVRYVQS